MTNEQTLTLLELNSLVRLTIEQTLSQEYWVEAELSECRESRGHCYMELVQKDDSGHTPVARATAKCWRSTWAMAAPYFERTTGQPIHAGMKVRLKVYAQFHEAFGFSWIVTDIDPNYTLGDMARRRQDIIRKLRQQGIFDLQKQLSLPTFCLHIAVISSPTAAGYGDFAAQLADSPYAFQTQLFPATMQGEQVEQSIISSLNEIYKTTSEGAKGVSPFDCVVIIRGGGATADLSGFDTLALAENVAQFPLPIITGIGHDRDESIIDMVSHLRVKTPTAAAAFLISHLKVVLDAINDAQDRIAAHTQRKLSVLKAQLSTLAEMLPIVFSTVKTKQEARLDSLYSRIIGHAQKKTLNSQLSIVHLENRLPILLERCLMKEKHQLQLVEEKIRSLDPALLLHRGYSMTMKDGRIVRDAKKLQTGDEIETILEKGTIKSIVK